MIGCFSNAPNWGPGLQPRYVSHWESNWWPFSLWEDAQPTKPYQSGLAYTNFKNLLNGNTFIISQASRWLVLVSFHKDHLTAAVHRGPISLNRLQRTAATRWGPAQAFYQYTVSIFIYIPFSTVIENLKLSIKEHHKDKVITLYTHND